jgi:hypothetical protein
MTMSSPAHRIVMSLTTATCLLGTGDAAASTGAAAASTGDLRVVDRVESRQLVVSAGPLSGGAVVLAGVLPRSGMVYQLSVEMQDAAGVPWHGAWSVTLTSGTTGAQASAISLGHLRRSLELPRPLGMGFVEGDSIHLSIVISAGSPAPLQLRLVAQYDAGQIQLGRIPVVAVRAACNATPEGAAAEWEWTLPVDGRLMALVGLSIPGAAELVLLDAATGTVVWREGVQPRTGEAFGGSADVIRVGVPLRAGRLYRLLLARTDGTVAEMAGTELHAMVRVPAQAQQAQAR